MAEHQEHPLNRHLFIADNLNLLRALDNESIDLICIDPPFAKNQDVHGQPAPHRCRTQSGSRKWRRWQGWGIRGAARRGGGGDRVAGRGQYGAVQRHLAVMVRMMYTRTGLRGSRTTSPALAKVIDTTRSAHSEGTAAYLTFNGDTHHRVAPYIEAHRKHVSALRQRR